MIKKLIEDKDLKKIIASTVLFTISFLLKNCPIIQFLIFLLSYLIISYEMYLESFKNIKDGEFFDENVLMILATIGAFCIGEYHEAVFIIILFQIGEYLSDLAVDKSRKNVLDLMGLKSETIRLLIKKQEVVVPIEDAKVNDIFVVYPGEKIPLDGVITNGDAFIDTSSLTGESIPCQVGKNDLVLSGTIVIDKVLTIKVQKTSEESTAQKILKLIEESGDKKAKTEKLITRFSRIYTPLIIFLALIIMICSIILGNTFHSSIYMALIFLVMSCPCALVLSIPLAYFCGIGRASREGILIKGANELEILSDIEFVLFDKTGTLTEGVFDLTEIHAVEKTENELLEIAAYGEYYSNHPISQSIKKAYSGKINTKKIKDFKEIRGKGIEVTIDNEKYCMGNADLLKENGIEIEKHKSIGTIVYIASSKKFLGYIIIADKIKEEAYSIVESLKQLGIKDTVMVSGDNVSIVRETASLLNISNYFASLLPEDKIKIVENYKNKGVTAFVGDGINDAPVIQSSDIGIAMGSIGSDAAIEASDVVLMYDNLKKIVEAIKISKFTKKLIYINISFALLVKSIVLILGILNLSTIWLAVFADVGVTLLCVLNTMQILNRKL